MKVPQNSRIFTIVRKANSSFQFAYVTFGKESDKKIFTVWPCKICICKYDGRKHRRSRYGLLRRLLFLLRLKNRRMLQNGDRVHLAEQNFFDDIVRRHLTASSILVRFLGHLSPYMMFKTEW